MTAPSDLMAAEPRVQHANAGAARNWQLLGTVSKYLLLIFFGAFFVLPWIWMISTSLKNAEDLAVYPIIWIPDPIRWDNYLEAFRRAEFARFLGNTMLGEGRCMKRWCRGKDTFGLTCAFSFIAEDNSG